MKIKKLNEAKKLVEEDVLDLNGSKQELAQDLQDTVKDLTNGEQGLTDKEAEKAADQITKTAEETGAGYVAFAINKEDWEDVKVVNTLFATLDDAYENALENMGKHQVDVTSNVLVEGLPGSGKTAIVNAWCRKHELTLVEMNATDPKIEAAINGLPLRDLRAQDNNENAITYAYATDDGNLGLLLNDRHPELKEKCVMFVDEFNRQKTAQLRRPFMSIFCNKRNANNSLNFEKNLLFCVVCINPSDGNGFKFHDEGVSELNSAEKDRFNDHLTFDSNINAAEQYWKWRLLNDLLEMGIIAPNSAASKNHDDWVGPTKTLDKDDLKYAKRLIKAYTLAMYILKNVTKSSASEVFSTRSEAHDEYMQGGYRPVTARGLESGIMGATKGDESSPVAKFLSWVDNRSRYSETKKKMFHEILDDYVMDVKNLFNMFNIDKTPQQIKAMADGTEIPDVSNNSVDNDAELEDDDETFSAEEESDVSKANADDVEVSEIDDLIKTWNK